MSTETSNNKRIAKNTLFLFFRMLLIMLVSLYTVRVVLATLGQEDYGIYNVVGGVITTLAFLTNTMVSASQRFFAYYIGKGDSKKLNEYFITTCLCYFAVGLIVIFLAETVGLWFVNNKLTIPVERANAAFWVFQCSIMGFIAKLFVIPHQSMIIAQERMNIYAYVSIVEVVLQLVIVYLLKIFQTDYLILYSVLQFLTLVVTTLWYISYSRLNFKESRFRLFYNKEQFKELIGYSSWNLTGALATVIRSQGINILLNMFFMPTVNAARAVAYQVNTAINSLSTNFFSAVKPQITKQYASGQKQGMLELVFRSSRFCYYILFVMALPIIIEAHFILGLWLKEVPEYTVLFTQLVVINALIDSVGHPLMTAVQATGKIKNYQLITAGLLIMNLPLSYIFLKLGYPPQTTMLISIAISVIAQISRMWFMKVQLQMSLHEFNKRVNIPIAIVTSTSILAPLILHYSFTPSITSSVAIMFVSVIMACAMTWLLGITSSERSLLINYLKKYKRK